MREAHFISTEKIEELHDGEGVEIVGTAVQIFDPRFFYVCPDCHKRVMETQGVFQCAEHAEVKPITSYVMNVVLDDGTGTIRAVLWKNQTNNLLGKTEDGVVLYKDNTALFEEIKNGTLGEQLKLLGQVKKNDMFSRLELNVQMVFRTKPEEELAQLEKKSS